MIAAFAAVSLISLALAAGDPNGTWKWTQQGGRGGGGGQGGGQGGQGRELTLTLAAKDGKLTGKLSQPGRGGGEPQVTEITNGTVTGDEISFTVEREFNGNKMVSKYNGKIDGDTIKGSFEAPGRGGGEPQKRDWEAKRAK
jgi:hypothetical protein